MPFINVKTNSEKMKENAEALKAALGECITLIPGKSEAWLMVQLEAPSAMYFKGNGAPCAMFDVSIYGSATDGSYDKLTEKLCEVSEEFLGVPSDRTYVKYTAIEHWGWNGMNF